MRKFKKSMENLRLEMRLSGSRFQRETALFPLQVAFHPVPTVRLHSAVVADRLLLLTKPKIHQTLLIDLFLQNMNSIPTCCLVVE